MLHFSLLQSTSTYLIAVLMFIFLVGFYYLGYRFRIWSISHRGDKSKEDVSTITGTLLGLLALLLAFSFGMSNSRYDTRRLLAVEEANHLSTAILRTDVLPDSIRTILRAQLKDYVEARVLFFKVGMDEKELVRTFNEANAAGEKVWKTTAAYARINPTAVLTSQLVPALNAMLDITTSRRAAGESSIPDSIIYFLFVLALCGAFLLGYDKKNKLDWVVVIGFATMLSITIFLIIDLDRPRSGLINLNKAHARIETVLQMFK